SRSRPSVSYERTAFGPRLPASSERMRSANASPTLPASSMRPAYCPSRRVQAAVTSEGAGLAAVDDDRRADHPRGALGDEERDDVGDLVDRPEPAPRELTLDERRDPFRILALPALPAPAGEEDRSRR